MQGENTSAVYNDGDRGVEHQGGEDRSYSCHYNGA